VSNPDPHDAHDHDHDQFTPERLDDRARIATVMATYARCADLNRPEEQAATFAEDGRVSYHPGVWIEGRARIAAALRESLARFQRTSHHLGNLEITFEGTDSATAQSTVIAWHRRNDGSEWTLFGRYVDRWVRQDRGWLIAERVLQVAGATGRDDSELARLGRAPATGA
jgi:3-phenylpropionate/cinnamic acid dioxygenase small subunit